MSSPMFVREVMTLRVGTVAASASIEEMRRLALDDDLLAVAVVDQRRPVAVLTRKSLDRAQSGPVEPGTARRFEQLGAQPPVVLAPDDLTDELPTVFHQSGTDVAVVVDHDEVVGLVTRNQLL